MTEADYSASTERRVALVTGAAHRVGAVIAQELHAQGLNVVVHYRRSRAAAQALCARLNAIRPASAAALGADLLDGAARRRLVTEAVALWGRLDGLVNNASTFYPTPLETADEGQWEDLLGSNLKAPFFLVQAAAPALRAHGGAVVNIVDIHAERPLKGHPIYSIAKAGLVMLTKSLARELAPAVRVNAVAPGAILWPERPLGEAERAQILDRIALKRQGRPEDVARAVRYLLLEADYTTGQVLAVDGGRSLSQ